MKTTETECRQLRLNYFNQDELELSQVGTLGVRASVKFLHRSCPLSYRLEVVISGYTHSSKGTV